VHPTRLPLRFHLAAAVLVLSGAAGCSDPASTKDRPVAQAAIEVRTLSSSLPEPGFDAVCEPGASVVLQATGSHDPAGQQLTYEWRDVVDGYLTPDFTPRANPLETNEVEVPAYFYTIGAHEITLTVTARDGRKASTTLRVAVVPCETCGG